MANKTYTQFGKFSVAILLPLLVFCVIMLIYIGFEEISAALILSFVVLTLLLCLLLFYKLTIVIDSSHVSFRLGLGMVSRKYLISDIKSCKPVKNSMLAGVGIRMLPDGWLYNVSGLHSIELTFKNRKSVVRIGTDKPDEIASEINKLLEAEMGGSSSDYSENSNTVVILAILFFALFMPIVLVLSGKREVKTTFTDSEFVVNGMYGLGIKLSGIMQLDTLSSLPAIRRRTNGYAAGKTLKGNFTLSDKSKIKLFITKENPPYISIRTDEVQIYLNFKDRRKTVELYNELNERVKR
jgi:hypothetical protein